ncbi:LysR family transcriptional regulator [Undibacterium terreum]|uniref:LysR family transcriptional regulator n=1 Tax=Undibacterium terreum TaxID=1224302 RepID=A0A916U5K3_9BURK|nr:LysR family transcriptional regulator [Undibacterium terreum]GGC61453.1 LysR family transcriptional regulator [Undibacterium terreum]
MDRFESMRIFTRIVELGSFTKAGEELGFPKATVTHAIKQLEARLRVRLLHRTTRQVTATLDGDAYYRRCMRLLADLEETENIFSEAAVNPAGKLRIDMHGTLGMHFVMPVLPQFCERYPNIELEIGMGDRLIDLVRESVDCVLRVGELRDSSMVARRVGTLEQVTCASPAYLKKYGIPQTPAELEQHRGVNFFSSQTGKAFPFDFIEDGKQTSYQLKGSVSINNADAYAACCTNGFGLIQVPRYHVEEALQQAKLQEILAGFRPDPMPVAVLYPHHRQLSPRVRVFVDWMAEIFAKAH